MLELLLNIVTQRRTKPLTAVARLNKLPKAAKDLLEAANTLAHAYGWEIAMQGLGGNAGEITASANNPFLSGVNNVDGK